MTEDVAGHDDFLSTLSLSSTEVSQFQKYQKLRGTLPEISPRLDCNARRALEDEVKQHFLNTIRSHVVKAGLAFQERKEYDRFLGVSLSQAEPSIVEVACQGVCVYTPRVNCGTVSDGYIPLLRFCCDEDRRSVGTFLKQDGRWDVALVTDVLCLMYPLQLNGAKEPAVRRVVEKEEASGLKVAPFYQVGQVLKQAQHFGRALEPHLKTLRPLYERNCKERDPLLGKISRMMYNDALLRAIGRDTEGPQLSAFEQSSVII